MAAGPQLFKPVLPLLRHLACPGLPLESRRLLAVAAAQNPGSISAKRAQSEP